MSMNQDPTPTAPVVVTFEQISKAISGAEAIGNLTEVSNRDASLDPVQKAAIMAGVGNVLRQLEDAERAAGAKVLTTPHDARAARLQSLVASGEAARLRYAQLPTGGFEALFDTNDWSGWATVVWEKLKHLVPHAMVRPKADAAAAFPDRGRIAVLGDWGTGLYGAPKIGKAVLADKDPFEIVLHLGDVYYSGTRTEVDQRFLNVWSRPRGATSRALNSNHEMYSGGDAYFDRILAAFGQEGSYFAYQNANWTLIGLDVAYHDHAIDDEQVRWLKEIVRKAGERKIVLFSHHQLYSNLEKAQGSKLWTHPEFGELLRSKRIFAWYWGHEHRSTIYEGPDSTFGLWARCIGHGSMPQSRDLTIGLQRATGGDYERADWRLVPAMGGIVPPNDPQTSDEATTFLLQSTAPSATAAVDGKFAGALIDGLRGKSTAKTWDETDDDTMIVRFDTLRRFVKARMDKQRVHNDVAGEDGETDGIIIRFTPAPTSKCTVRITGGDPPPSGEIISMGKRNTAAVRNAIVGEVTTFVLKPDRYKIAVEMANGGVRDNDRDVVIFDDVELSFERLAPGAGVQLSRPEADTVNIGLPKNLTVQFEELATGKRSVFQGASTAPLSHGRYAAIVLDQNDRVLKWDDLVVNAETPVKIADWSDSSPHVAIASHFPVDDDSVFFSESIGPIADPDLNIWLALIGGGRIMAGTPYTDYSKIKELPLHDFSGEQDGCVYRKPYRVDDVTESPKLGE
jgi:hypothetical protein